MTNDLRFDAQWFVSIHLHPVYTSLQSFIPEEFLGSEKIWVEARIVQGLKNNNNNNAFTYSKNEKKE